MLGIRRLAHAGPLCLIRDRVRKQAGTRQPSIEREAKPSRDPGGGADRATSTRRETSPAWQQQARHQGDGLFVQLCVGYHLPQNHYSFDALQAYCFGINIKL